MLPEKLFCLVNFSPTFLQQ